MKIGNAIIQNRKIEQFDDNNFFADYKGREIQIYTDHGYGQPEEEHLKRFWISVKVFEGEHDYEGWYDCETIVQAIKEALKGSCLMPEKST